MDAKATAELAAKLISDKKGRRATALYLGGLSFLCDYFVICHGGTRVHTQAIADHLDEELGKAGIPLGRKEGYQEGKWILLDFGQVIVHVFQEEERTFYSLERLWGDAPQLEIRE